MSLVGLEGLVCIISISLLHGVCILYIMFVPFLINETSWEWEIGYLDCAGCGYHTCTMRVHVYREVHIQRHDPHSNIHKFYYVVIPFTHCYSVHCSVSFSANSISAFNDSIEEE